MKGVFELRPPTARYKYIWDVNIVLSYLKNFYPLEELSLSYLTHKLCMLLALTTMQRSQTIHAIDITDIKFFDSLVIIPIHNLMKQSSQRNNRIFLHLKPYLIDPSICVVEALKAYIARTKTIRGNVTQLFMSYQKPYKAVSKDTISRWLKKVLEEAGIDIEIFKGHSTRAASSSAARRDDVPIDQILNTAGWSNDETFKRFYDRIIEDH